MTPAEEMATQISETRGGDNGAILKESVVGAKEIPSPLQGEMKARAEIPAAERGTTTQKQGVKRKLTPDIRTTGRSPGGKDKTQRSGMIGGVAGSTPNTHHKKAAEVMRTKEEPDMTLKTHLLDGRSGLWAARIPDPKERFPEMMERKVAVGGTAKTLLRLIKVTPERAETLQMTDAVNDVTTFQRK